jgi:hypothetical protein
MFLVAPFAAVFILDLYMGRPMGFLGGPWAGPFGPFSPQICINYMQDIQYY